MELLSITQQRLKLATSNLHAAGVCQGPYNITPRRGKVGVALGWGSFVNLGFPCNISAMAEASALKFGVQLGFAKAHHKIPPEEK